MNDKPFYITFYSYRGGADRLAALVNVGVDLARRGHKVLLVDFDLESPGLTALAPLRPEQPHSGLVEFVAEYLDTNQAPPVSEYLYRAASIGKKGGELWVMPAGKEDPDYWAALARINWQELYDLHAGFLFIEDTRVQWQQEVKPDYVLINAPGGINDRTAICTRQLPDLVMLLAAADGTDRAGLQLACAEIRAEAEENPHKDIALALIQTGVSDSPDADRRRLREDARDFACALGLERVDARIHRDDRLFSDDRPALQARPRGLAAREYRRLARLCMTANCEHDRDGAHWFLKRLQKELEKDPLLIAGVPGRGAHGRPAGRLERVLEKFIGDTEIVLAVAACLFTARRIQQALYTLDEALEDQPDAIEIRFRRAEYSAKWNRNREAVQELVRILDTSGIAADQVMRAMRQLRELSPEQHEEARQKPAVQALGKMRVRLLSLAHEVRPGLIPTDDCRTLLVEHRWKEVIARLEPQVNCSPDFGPWDAFHLAVAYWGATGNLRADLCKRGLDKLLEQLPKGDPISLSDYQLVSLMLWGAGESENALEVLKEAEDRADELLASEVEKLVFPTFWRSTRVSFDQFKEDCQDQRLLIRGAKIRPPFLEYRVIA